MLDCIAAFQRLYAFSITPLGNQYNFLQIWWQWGRLYFCITISSPLDLSQIISRFEYFSPLSLPLQRRPATFARATEEKKREKNQSSKSSFNNNTGRVIWVIEPPCYLMHFPLITFLLDPLLCALLSCWFSSAMEPFPFYQLFTNDNSFFPSPLKYEGNETKLNPTKSLS